MDCQKPRKFVGIKTIEAISMCAVDYRAEYEAEPDVHIPISEKMPDETPGYKVEYAKGCYCFEPAEEFLKEFIEVDFDAPLVRTLNQIGMKFLTKITNLCCGG